MAKKQPMYGSEASTNNDAIADLAVTFTAHTWDGSTDPTADQGNKIKADLAAIETKLNAIIAALENFGILKT